MEIRTARPSDQPQIATLLASRMEPEDVADHLRIVSDPDAGWESCAVAVDGDRVVSTATLLDETVTLGGVSIPAGQVELVATDRAYEGQGLVRRLMDWAHQRSSSRGHLLQVMIGIPYFYRQFGYSYALPMPLPRPVVSAPSSGLPVRRAVPDDIPTLMRLQEAAQSTVDLRMPHSAACWRWVISSFWVAERDGTVVACARGESSLSEVAAVDALAAQSLLCLKPTSVFARTSLSALDPFLGPAAGQLEEYYVRIPDPVALFSRLRPVFAARLAGQPDTEVLVSFFRSHIRFAWDAGTVGPVVAGGVLQGPASLGGAGVAPDKLAPLLFGPRGMAGLASLHSDVYPGPHVSLMETLFPPVTADLLTFYQP